MIYGLFLCIILSIFLFPFSSQPASQPYSLSLSLWLNRYLFRHFSRSIVFSSFPYSRNYKQDDSMIRWEIKLDRISFSDCTSLSFTYNKINFYNHIMIMIYNILVFSYRSKRKQIENCSMPNRISKPTDASQRSTSSFHHMVLKKHSECVAVAWMQHTMFTCDCECVWMFVLCGSISLEKGRKESNLAANGAHHKNHNKCMGGKEKCKCTHR